MRGDDDGEGGDAAARDAFLVFFSFFSFLAALAAFLAAFLEAFSADPSGTTASPPPPGDSAAAARAATARATAARPPWSRKTGGGASGSCFVLFLPIAATDERQTARRALRGGREGEGGIWPGNRPRAEQTLASPKNPDATRV